MIPDANIFQPLVDLANSVLKFFHDNAGLSWGGAIIALTFATRIVLIPLTYKQLKGMRMMQALQPQIKEIQAKFKNDKQRMQQEMMNFYKENKVNPFASCIPLLAQFPVFIALFSVLRHELPADIGCEAGHCGSQASFLFIPDLTAKATGGVLVVLIVLYVATQLASGLMMSASADKSQRTMMLALPLVFVIFIINFPAGLILYWITTNVWTIGQSYTLQRLIPAPTMATPEAIAAAKPPPPPPKKKKKRR